MIRRRHSAQSSFSTTRKSIEAPLRRRDSRPLLKSSFSRVPITVSAHGAAQRGAQQPRNELPGRRSNAGGAVSSNSLLRARPTATLRPCPPSARRWAHGQGLALGKYPSTKHLRVPNMSSGALELHFRRPEGDLQTGLWRCHSSTQQRSGYDATSAAPRSPIAVVLLVLSHRVAVEDVGQVKDAPP